MRADRLLQTFLDLVRIDSPTGYEEKVREYVLHFLQKLDLNPIQDARGNLILKINGVGEPLLLGVHLDTVEPGKNIKPQIVKGVVKSGGDTILGADNKVAVAGALEALMSIIENKIQTKPLSVVFTLSEETGEFGSTKLDYEKISAKKGYTFDSLSPLGTIITASPFYNRFDMKIIGKSAHASTPDEGINTLKILVDAIGKTKLGKVNDKTVINIGIVNSGQGINTVPGETIIKGEVRSFVEEDVEFYTSQITKRFNETALRHRGRIELSVFRDSPGYEYSTKDKFVNKTKKLIEEFGLKTVLIKNWACSDANIFHAHGIKTLNLGDGVNNPHTVKESVSVSDIVKLSELIIFLVGISIDAK